MRGGFSDADWPVQLWLDSPGRPVFASERAIRSSGMPTRDGSAGVELHSLVRSFVHLCASLYT